VKRERFYGQQDITQNTIIVRTLPRSTAGRTSGQAGIIHALFCGQACFDCREKYFLSLIF
jgi:hypothetical protein